MSGVPCGFRKKNNVHTLLERRRKVNPQETSVRSPPVPYLTVTAMLSRLLTWPRASIR